MASNCYPVAMVVNVISFSSSGGAGNVSKSLVYGLRKIGLEANLITASHSNLRSRPLQHPKLTLAASVDEYIHKRSNWDSLFSLERDNNSSIRRELPKANLNIFRWMNGVLGESFIKKNSDLGQIVWGLDDMNPFTGGCHYSGNCDLFKSDCNPCPAVRIPSTGRVKKNLERKELFAENRVIQYVAPTDWIYEEFQTSRIGEGKTVRKILNPLQPAFFENVTTCKNGSGKLRLLIVATNLDDATKGVWDVAGSLNAFLENSNVQLTLAGSCSRKLRSSLPRASFTGPLEPGSVREQMRNHDALIVPSQFENAGTVVAEAASQGLATIAREVGGMPEMTNFGNSGYLFKSATELEDILASLSKKDLEIKGQLARDWSQKLRPELVATQYVEAFL